jgi:hypothetical protein
VGGDGVVAGLGEAKVGDLGAHAGVKEDVAALDVLVILCTTRGQVCSWMYWRPWARSRVTRSSRTRTPGSIHQVAVAHGRVDAGLPRMSWAIKGKTSMELRTFTFFHFIFFVSFKLCNISI